MLYLLIVAQSLRAGMVMQLSSMLQEMLIPKIRR
jgi:hypothetical protein